MKTRISNFIIDEMISLQENYYYVSRTMVNTFIVSNDYATTAKLLDYKRLGKQRVEAMQIINVLENKSESRGWKSHPAVKMWTGYTDDLKRYTNCMIREWISRGYNNTMKLYDVEDSDEVPWFVKSKFVQYSHMASLVRKLPSHYEKLFSFPKKFSKFSYIWTGDLDQLQIETLVHADDIDLSEFADKIDTRIHIIVRIRF